MAFIGIDLAADPRRTGMAAVSQEGSGCTVDFVRVDVDDDAIVEVIDGSDPAAEEKVGVDVPFGWPRSFVDLVTAHARGTLAPPESTSREWRRGLAMRETDRLVHRRTGMTPLSVSTDRIAHPALRRAGIEARLRDLGVCVARDGGGLVCEVYPAAALRCWGFDSRGYKTATNARARLALATAMTERLPWLDWNGHRQACIEDDNALDAVIAALTAREVAGGAGSGAPTGAHGDCRAGRLDLASE